MHSKTSATLLTSCLLSFTAISPLAAKGIEVRSPAGADVSQHATYGWMPTPSRVPDHPLSLDSPQGQLLRRDIEAALQTKGYTYSDEPGFLLRVNGVITDRYNFSGKSDKIAKGVVWEYGGSGTKQSAEGTLVLEALDTSGEKLLWAGLGRTKLSGTQSPDKTMKKAQGILKKILKEFPSR